MSKSLKGIILGLAALFVAILIGGISFVSRDSENNRIAELEHNLRQAEREKAKAEALASQTESAASSQTAKAEELAHKIEEIQQAALQRVAQGNKREPAPKIEGKYGLGRAALDVEVAAWDVDVLPDGRGLPAGSGDAIDGEEVFAEKCASCHGDFAEGVDNWPVLAGGLDTLADKDPVKTVGSYWPHLSTVWDYVNRSMPFGEAQTLTPDEVYAITAYILYSNDLIEDDFVLSNENFADFEMHNKDGFVLDTRPEEEYALWKKEPCMEDCKETVSITMRASVLDVTPDEAEGEGSGEKSGSAMSGHQESSLSGPTFSSATNVSAAEDKTEVPVANDEIDPALVTAGKKVYKKCSACHQIGENAKNKTGPHLNDLMGRTIGGVEDYKYSKVFKAAKSEGRVWDEAALTEFLKKPRSYMKGTKMSFAGLKKDTEVESLIAFFIKAAESQPMK